MYILEGAINEITFKLVQSVEHDPLTCNEAISSRVVALWKEDINDEMDSIMSNRTWVLYDLSLGYKPIGCKWICKCKLRPIDKFKIRLVAKDYRQKESIDYFDTYVARSNMFHKSSNCHNLYFQIIYTSKGC